MSDKNDWGPFPPVEPSIRITGCAAVGTLIGAFCGALWGEKWSGIAVTAVLTGLACGLAMVTKIALEARDRRKYRRTESRPYADVIDLRSRLSQREDAS